VSERPLVLVVGMLNPYGADPDFALYHLPREASGNRLRQIMGLSDVEYEKLDKVNLCCGTWSMKEAKAAAQRIREEPDSSKWPRNVILLGSKVRDAFGLKTLAFYDYVPATPQVILLPHPSGRNLIWNDPFSFVRAREVLRKCIPEIPWGSADS